jgi:glycosyltransferase involved in cell wall biosynthesis
MTDEIIKYKQNLVNSRKLYFLVTPIKNEETNLPNIIATVERQSIQPFLWIIVNDCSIDNSAQIIKQFKERLPWIYDINLLETREYLGINYARVCKIGFDFGIKYCEKHKIDYKYIGLLDADIILPQNYYSSLISEFDKNGKLGIASGGLIIKNNETVKHISVFGDLPSGATRLWSKKCFLESGGYLLVHSPDSVSNIKAKLRGYDTKRFEYLEALHTREISGAQGLWKGHYKDGEGAYYLNQNPLLVFLNGVNRFFSLRGYTSLAYILGYSASIVKRSEKIEDEEIKNYYFKVRLGELGIIYSNKIKNLFHSKDG